MQNVNLLIIFLTGLTTGGLTCLALQGGLLTSVLASANSSPLSKGEAAKPRGIKNHQYLPILSFLGAKLLIHTLLGFLLGALGATISLSPITRGWLQIAIGIYLFGIAGNLLNLHPFFRYFIITPPKFLARLVKKSTQQKNLSSKIYDLPGRQAGLFAPAILGLMTVFIPCATTQAMEVIAIGTGNPLYGAAIMFAFVLGTSPTFLLFGFLLEKGSVSFKKYFPYVASVAMIIMSIFSVNSGIAVMGSPYTLQNFYSVVTNQSTPNTLPSTIYDLPGRQAGLQSKKQTTTITVTNSGYTPTNISLKKGVLTRLKLITSNVQSCSRAFTIPGLNIEKVLPPTGETIIEFTPTETGPLAFSCSMGMYTGKFNIVD